jgi:hypothetical protein
VAQWNDQVEKPFLVPFCPVCAEEWARDNRVPLMTRVDAEQSEHG